MKKEKQIKLLEKRREQTNESIFTRQTFANFLIEKKESIESEQESAKEQLKIDQVLEQIAYDKEFVAFLDKQLLTLKK